MTIVTSSDCALSSSELSPLTAAEATALEQHEALIERGLQIFVEVGEALLAIRDGRLYRGVYPTFEDYCQQRWGWTRIRAYQLIQAAEVTEIVVNHGLQPPQNERQCRELARLREPEAIRETWTALEEELGENVTAADVRAAVDVRKAARPAPVQVDVDRMAAPGATVAAGTIQDAAQDFESDGKDVFGDADDLAEHHAERLRRQEEESRQERVAFGLETDDGRDGPLAIYENLVSYARPCLDVKDMDQLASYLLVRGRVDEQRDFLQQLRDWLLDVDEALCAAVQHAHDGEGPQ
jgi:hypothetical protein